MKKVSIIIPCYNCSEWIRQGWNSLRNQTIGLDEIECIFVNDASTDCGKTQKVLEQIEKEAPESVMIIALEENMRQGGARNIGMQYMTGEYMLLMDADDLYRPETCKELYDIAKSYDADIVRFDHDIVVRDMSDDSIPPLPREMNIEAYDLIQEEIRKAFLAGKAESFGCTNKFYSTEVIRRTGSSFGEKVVYEEPKFVYPLFLYVNRLVAVDKKYYIWRKHPGSTMTSEVGVKLLDHPKVQLQLLSDLMGYGDLFEKFKEEIHFHFFYSYYYETLFFAVMNNNRLGVELFSHLQDTCKKLCPDIRKNRYLSEFKFLIPVADSLDDHVSTQKQLDAKILRLIYDACKKEVKAAIPNIEGILHTMESSHEEE